MRELTLENLRNTGMRIKVTLWGDSISELTRNLEAHVLNPRPVVAVVAGVYVKQYFGKASLSSTNATKIYFDLDIPEVLHIRERSSHRTPPHEITIPVRVSYNQAAKSIGDTTMSISQLLEAKWESGYNMLNRKVCRAKDFGISTEKGWYYLGCNNCTTKLVGNTRDHWCPSCKVQVYEPVPRYLLRLEVEDSSGTAFFVAMDSEVQKIVQLPALDAVAKGEFTHKTMCKATATQMIKSWYYLSCTNCNHGVMDCYGELWCS
ncbi:replication protein A 70 kDa DNA-binding subunit A-like isoform X1 [Papaver somniferum]|uniref:replication protein A 70 kDa DNA-binding subunit A-like isoform X1 n=1 Tax=Papaver somniferum TaxID=3469 RepID=UPI000E6F847B|nr:replication protein A 70 kDa DNA-binding subunit A-like isoform X1 [Papaver somniferum]XP_026439564.1 replication protein A 70 kDa DNA-binding subunit A-like isoform X1 [Papaver somniferum]XP_026439565.1 replication protein A 70 kDa DNA-binding subunit A-like isoform X1 [Papaver somniferum]XP_026439992.1 replication protein A 70 kDa DNA-binding subunit A-like isoform X1 [Papaver somniferum]XP_026439994.1 replication protein A 70 kDa DNA-binding subunit A-like isoform X1 [Papaver somniferum]